MVSEIERISQVDALVAVRPVVECQRGKDTQFDPGSVSVLLDRSYDLDSALGLFPFVVGFDNLSERALTQELDDIVAICHDTVRLHDVMSVVVVNFLMLVHVLDHVSIGRGMADDRTYIANGGDINLAGLFQRFRRGHVVSKCFRV